MVVAGVLALWARRRTGTPRARFWARMLAGLAVLDLAWVVLVFLIGSETIHIRHFDELDSPRLQIGVFVDPMSEDGVSIERVRPGFPAEQAGLSRGDTVFAVDGLEVASEAELSTAIDRGVSGRPLAIEVVRDGEHLSLEVTPVSVGAPGYPTAPGIFEPLGLSEEDVLGRSLDGLLRSLPAYAVLALAWLLARRRGERATEFAGWVLVIFLAWWASDLIVPLGLTRALGGFSNATYIGSLLISCLARTIHEDVLQTQQLGS